MTAAHITSDNSEVMRRSLSAPRMVGLETACEILGDKGGIKHVAELIGCSPRAVFDKREGNMTISNLEVRLLARELAKVADRCARVSANLFREIGEGPVEPAAPSIGAIA
ncbi:MAG: hypothetical protein V3V60_08535 [Sphingomonas aquatilis]|uniref:hypothetical protein n=1 Tax=Sphingomonas aquatilis TaxID=93063 RepID=UPI002F356A9C